MTPDAVEFAKTVLLRLSWLQADVYQNQLLLIELLASVTKRDPVEIQNTWKAETERMANERYLEALRTAGLPIEPGDSSHPSNRSRL